MGVSGMAEEINFVILLIGGLVTWRWSHALVKELGPLGLFARIRARLARKQRIGGLYDLFACTSCMSIWIGLLTSLWVTNDIVDLLIYGFAFSAISMVLEASFGRKKNENTY